MLNPQEINNVDKLEQVGTSMTYLIMLQHKRVGKLSINQWVCSVFTCAHNGVQDRNLRRSVCDVIEKCIWFSIAEIIH